MRKLVCFFFFLFICHGILGCQQKQSSASSDPKVLSLDKEVYCTLLSDDRLIVKTYTSNLDVTVQDYSNEKDTVDIFMDGPLYRNHTFDHKDVAFQIMNEDQGLPYYCAHGYLYNNDVHGPIPFVFAIDFQKEYFILKPNGNTSDCLIASTDPNADPLEIHAHFSRFLEIYHYPD